jgi:limonene-1,2-epoxide hydrolase
VTPEDTVNDFIAAVTSGGWNRAVELAADDIVYENIGFGPTSLEAPFPRIDGSAAMVDFLRGMQDADWTVHRQDVLGNVVVNERTDRFTFGEVRIELPVAGVFEVRDGRITFWRDYFDLGLMQQQLSGGSPGSSS